MSITAEQKAHVLQLLRQKYPDWNDFSHQEFRRDEINYKRLAAKKAASLLSESALAHLLVTRETEAFIERLERLGEATSMLQRSESDHGDLEILYVPTLDRPVFCAQIYHLLHGTESVNDRLAAYLQYIEDHELPNTWNFPTYLLQFCYPNTEIFVEPRPTEWFLKYTGMSSSLGKPTPEMYVTVKLLARNLKQGMADFRPLDMIDIQSLIHVCYEVTEPVLMASYDDSMTLQEHALYFGDLDGFDGIEGGDGETTEAPEAGGAYWEDDESRRASLWQESQENEDADSTMLFISEVKDESYTEVPESQHPDASSPVDLDRIRELHKKSLFELYDLFLTSYMTSPAGVARAAAYARAREAAEHNFAQLIANHELGEVVTNRVFLHLLPHEDTEANQQNDAWIHPVYASATSLLATLNQKYGGESKIREQISQVLLEFIRHCVYKSNALDRSSEALVRLDAISLITLSAITPILHALKPAQYILLHEPVIKVINHFGKVALRSNLQALPELTAKAFEIIESLQKNEAAMRFSSVHTTDLFDMFAFWLVEKQHFFHSQDRQAENNSDRQAQFIPDRQREFAPDRLGEVAPDRQREVAPGRLGGFVSDRQREEPEDEQPEPAFIPADTPPDPKPEVVRPGRSIEEPFISAPPADQPAERLRTASERHSTPPASPVAQAEAYPIERCASETGFPAEVLERWRRILYRKKHMLFSGPAGTGKTFMAQHLARMFVQNSDGLVHLLHFHPGFTYANFMGHATDDREEGIFRAFCKEAAQRSGPCILILDDVNRVDIAGVFGELLYMLEYRDIGFALSNPHPFDVPSNVFIVGTLHPDDSSKVSIDSVVGRRFAFIRLEPAYGVLKSFHGRTGFPSEGLIRTLMHLNEQIASPDRKIGITYFLRSDLANHIGDIWTHEVEPQMEWAFEAEPDKASAFRWDRIRQQVIR